MVIYDCGHLEHAEAVESFLNANVSIKNVYVVVSHNDCDHTQGIISILKWLKENDYSTKIYTHQYLKHVNTILDKINDNRRRRERLKEALLKEFDNIKLIIETAQEYGFEAIEALCDINVSDCTIVGPSTEEFTDVAAKAVDNRESDNIGEGNEQETVMNAASIQLKCELDDGKSVLLCGDACPKYLHELNNYDIIQLPHHGQLDDAKAIFEELDKTSTDSYSKEYFISDNTGSGKTSGGSDDLVEYMKNENYTIAHNTKNCIVYLPVAKNMLSSNNSNRRSCLGDLDCSCKYLQLR